MTNGYQKWIRLLIAGAMAFFCPLRAEPESSKYDNLVLGVPGKVDTIVDRPGYALGYIEYHEQPAWVIYNLKIGKMIH